MTGPDTSAIKKVVLAYSGGLDTSVILKWLQVTYGCEVVTFTADLGQGEELEPARAKAKLMGLPDENIYIDDLREEFVRDFVFPMMRANARYEGDYLLGTSIARPLISKRLVEMLHGDIRADSSPGQGTHFEVSLPLIPSPPTLAVPHMPRGAPMHAQAQAGGRLQSVRVLAAEDNLVNQMVLSELLKHEGAQVTMSDSGMAVIAKLQQSGQQAFDVVLMDIQMPQMDGYDATRQVKRIAPDLPVIGQTAHAMSEEHAKCLDAGMVDLVVKPIDLEALVKTIRRHVPPTKH